MDKSSLNLLKEWINSGINKRKLHRKYKSLYIRILLSRKRLYNIIYSFYFQSRTYNDDCVQPLTLKTSLYLTVYTYKIIFVSRYLFCSSLIAHVNLINNFITYYRINCSCIRINRFFKYNYINLVYLYHSTGKFGSL